MNYPNPYQQSARPSGPGYPAPSAYESPAQGFGPSTQYFTAPAQQNAPRYAGWGSRVGATLLDGLFLGIPVSMLYGLAVLVGIDKADCATVMRPDGTFEENVCRTHAFSSLGITLLLVATLLSVLGGIYLVYMEGKTGQTPGKRIAGIRLISERTGLPLGFGAALGRKICHAVDSLACYLGYLWPLWDDKCQTLADKIVKSVVVHV
jgi:uncharacterized RDD family membrane protein YckC